MDIKHIFFTGGSGIGKTTLAKALEDDLKIPFISSSYSDLLPETKHIPHSTMVNDFSAQQIMNQDRQLLSLRAKKFNELHEQSYVTDRSALDSAAFWINKLSTKGIADCDTEAFIENCRQVLFQQCTELIFIPVDKHFMDNWGPMENNGKRITSQWYQFQISQLMYGVLEMWGFHKYSHIGQNIVGYLPNLIKVLILRDTDLTKRISTIKYFLNLPEDPLQK